MSDQEIRDTVRGMLKDWDAMSVTARAAANYHAKDISDRRARVIEARRKLLDNKVTLNGKPAIISGIKEDYATVRTLDKGDCVVSCAWTTVLTTIKRKEGNFVS